MYLMVENQGVSDAETFMVLGVSSTRYSRNENTIGKFGSGVKQAICVFLRNSINPIIYLGNLRLEFFTKLENIRDVEGTHAFNQVCCRLTGKDSEGRQINRTEKCGFVTEFGELDWTKIEMGLREIISNALDASYKLVNSNSGMRVETVGDNQVRAKAGYTRFYIPMVPEVSHYYNNIYTKFLHFSHGSEVYKDSLMCKRNDKTNIYRRGVWVGEIEAARKSLWDYNIRELELDESRNMKSWVARTQAAKLLRESSVTHIVSYLCLLKDISSNEDYWELSFDEYSLGLKSDYYEEEQRNKIKNNWLKAWGIVFGDNAVLCGIDRIAEIVSRKGYKTVLVKNTRVYNTLQSLGIPVGEEKLDDDELEGFIKLEASPAVVKSFRKIWDMLVDKNLHANKEEPQLKCFAKEMQAESMRMGEYRQGTIYIHNDIAENESFLLRQTMLEEIAHHITGSTDNSRDFQDFAFRIATVFMEGCGA